MSQEFSNFMESRISCWTSSCGLNRKTEILHSVPHPSWSCSSSLLNRRTPDRKMFLAKRLVSGIMDVVSNIDPNQFIASDPPPTRSPLAYAEAQESNEEKQFRKVFRQLAGEDMEVSPKELMDILNRIMSRSVISSREVPVAFKAAGFPLNEQLFNLIVRRYSDERGDMDFDNYVGCLVRLDAMCPDGSHLF
ncbi:unnamed protein product [Lota lota]